MKCCIACKCFKKLVLKRLLYSVNDKPVIAVSSIQCDYTVEEPQCFLIKESYNYVDFDKAMQIVVSYAYAGDTCPNPNDPLFLNFRIMSKNDNIYDSMTETLKNKLGDHLLGKEYSYENNGRKF